MKGTFMLVSDLDKTLIIRKEPLENALYWTIKTLDGKWTILSKSDTERLTANDNCFPIIAFPEDYPNDNVLKFKENDDLWALDLMDLTFSTFWNKGAEFGVKSEDNIKVYTEELENFNKLTESLTPPDFIIELQLDGENNFVVNEKGLISSLKLISIL